MSKITMTA